MLQTHLTLSRCLLTALFLPCLMASMLAQHFYYAPNMTFLPGISEKHDAGLQIGVSQGPKFKALELQAAYSPVNHIAVVLGYFSNGAEDVKKGTDVGTRFHFPEAGLCAYRNIRRGMASISAGYGQSHILNYYGKGLYSDVSLRRWFVQPGFEYRDAYTRVGLMLRLSRLTYDKGMVDFIIPSDELIALRSIERNSVFFLPELGLSCAFKLEMVYLGFTYTVIFPDTSGLNFSRLNLGLWLMFDIGEARQAGIKKRKGKAG